MRQEDKNQKDKSQEDKSIVLIGLMGVGKSKVGAMLAARLKKPFFDSDATIEAEENMKIAAIFETRGEAYFRTLEARIFKELLCQEPGVIASGGGAFMHKQTRALINAAAVSVWLKAEPTTLAKRMSNTDKRPLLKGKDVVSVLAELARLRYPVYAEAQITVDTDGLSLEAAARTVEAVIHQHLSES